MIQQQDIHTPQEGLLVTEEMLIHRFARVLRIFDYDKAIEKYEKWDKDFSEFPGWDHTRSKLEDMIYEHKNPKRNCELPPELSTPKAMKYWERLEEEGFVDCNHQLCPSTSRQQAWYIAELFAEKLELKNTKWKPFQMLWGINNLAQEKQHSQDTGQLPNRAKDIDKIFED